MNDVAARIVGAVVGFAVYAGVSRRRRGGRAAPADVGRGEEGESVLLAHARRTGATVQW